MALSHEDYTFIMAELKRSLADTHEVHILESRVISDEDGELVYLQGLALIPVHFSFMIKNAKRIRRTSIPKLIKKLTKDIYDYLTKER